MVVPQLLALSSTNLLTAYPYFTVSALRLAFRHRIFPPRDRDRRRRSSSGRTGSPKPASTIGQFTTILRSDRRFANYQASMFAAGFGNMLIEAPLIFLITRELSASCPSIGLTMVIPFAISLLSLPLWARYLDRCTLHSFAPGKVFCTGASAHVSRSTLCSIAWLAVSRVVMGIARGGAFSRQLGHNDLLEQISYPPTWASMSH